MSNPTIRSLEQDITTLNSTLGPNINAHNIPFTESYSQTLMTNNITRSSINRDQFDGQVMILEDTDTNTNTNINTSNETATNNESNDTNETNESPESNAQVPESNISAVPETQQEPIGPPPESQTNNTDSPQNTNVEPSSRLDVLFNLKPRAPYKKDIPKYKRPIPLYKKDKTLYKIPCYMTKTPNYKNYWLNRQMNTVNVDISASVNNENVTPETFRRNGGRL